MTGFRRWLGKWLGVQAAVQERAVEDLEAAAALGGAMGRFEMAREATEFAADLDARHPELAAAFRAQVADLLGLPTPIASPTPAALDKPPAPPPPGLPEAAPKKTPVRTKKAAEPGTGPSGNS